MSVTPSRERWSRKRAQPITGSVGDFNFLTSTDSFVFGQIHFPIRTNTSPGQWGRRISIFSLGWRASTDSFVFGQIHFSLYTVQEIGEELTAHQRECTTSSDKVSGSSYSLVWVQPSLACTESYNYGHCSCIDARNCTGPA